jgi:hypothetical protein
MTWEEEEASCDNNAQLFVSFFLTPFFFVFGVQKELQQLECG